ncbi:MAG: bifunctional 3,4-dihydroxy-2-butanone 4-phosphate synthase/GTP cyclohydrolase II [Candidatus Melainabacteria bacterium RIFOXYA12_FULL_32_12]|nr:MAG: bifunctional 3,4-dihydroxy-2-butanone 4-phosphate synthase/GTP cyclohydrolase II [Candidatus Melainabacteria bacterium RIFOXYA2_FULL_32_9]OGI30706.1 MAG: bifunctional 3,4-dihydroxy-2-butanone 4-phosphate synthase/GTP cyclohydrolase II [Candidatus Melainabacteria bacterium RIFOXYA12_FULL_32_12]
MESIKNKNEYMYNTVEEAIQDIRNGKMVIVADDETRENEGDLVCAAEKVTPEIINFMVTEARGLICLTLTAERTQELNLYQMVNKNTESHGCAFTISIDAEAAFGVTTGISAKDRATTIKVAVDPNTKPSDLRKPGHIFPIEAKKGGVLERVGQTEASVDLARLAGLTPAGVICEILNPDGTMARRDDLAKFAKEHNIKFITVAQLISYRLQQEKFVKRVIKAKLPTIFGEFDIYGYLNELDKIEHVALVKGNLEDFANSVPVVRMHSECLTGDIFHSLRCDCGNQLGAALDVINEEGAGVLVYLRSHEGRGIGLLNKLKAYSLQEKGEDTVQANLSLGFAADLRDYGVGAQILLDLGLRKFRLITNNPRKIIGLEGYDLEVVDRVALPICLNKHNERYLHTKRDKLNHML